MLADAYGQMVEDEECGHLVTLLEVDGRQVRAHHTIPDDAAPHAPYAECACGPQLHQVTDVLWVFEHNDQDGDSAEPWEHGGL